MTRYENIQRKVVLLELFYKIHGREPKELETFREENIGYFLESIRRGRTKLEKEEYLRLKKLGFRLVTLNRKEEVRKKVELLKEFYLNFGREPESTEIYKGAKLGVFLKTIRSNGVNLSEKEKKDLIKVGYSLKTKTAEMKEKKIKALLSFYKSHGRLPKRNENFRGERIGVFVTNVKSGKTKIPEEHIEEFKKMGLL